MPSIGPSACELVGTVSISASGGIDEIYPVKSNCAFSDVTLIVLPLQDDTLYKVEVYVCGELTESHTYSSALDKPIVNMKFPMMFPANTGTNTIPKFYNPYRQDFTGEIIMVRITNNSATTKRFQVYAVFLEWDPTRFKVVNFESQK
jgi:hypothetical protein